MLRRIESWLFKNRTDLFRLWRKAKYLLQSNFFIFAICLAAMPLLSSVLLGGMYRLALIGCILNVILFIAYQLIYALKFKKLTDSYSPAQYYYQLFDLWPLVCLNVLFLIGFCYLLFLLNLLINEFFDDTRQITYYSILAYTLQNIVDGLSFEFLSTFGLRFSNIKVEHWWGKSIIYIHKIIVSAVIIATIVKETSKRIQLRKELECLRGSSDYNSELFARLDHVEIRFLLRELQGAFKDSQFEKRLLKILAKSRSYEVRSLFLRVLDETRDTAILSFCLEYFRDNKDKRLEKVIHRLSIDPTKKEVFLKHGLRTC